MIRKSKIRMVKAQAKPSQQQNIELRLIHRTPTKPRSLCGSLPPIEKLGEYMSCGSCGTALATWQIGGPNDCPVCRHPNVGLSPSPQQIARAKAALGGQADREDESPEEERLRREMMLATRSAGDAHDD